MANTRIPVQPWSWVDQLDEELDNNITVANGGYEAANSASVTLNSGVGGIYANTSSITGSNGIVYTAGTVSQNTWATNTSMKGGTLELEGEGADVLINGKSLTEVIARLEERLNILTPNTKLEADWEELRELGNRYRELEEHIKAKMKTFETLKRYDE